jgi:hypothetical protein
MATLAQLIESVEAARRSLLESVAGLTEAQASFRPGVGRWTVAEVAEHLYLAELSGVTKIWAALDAFRAGRVWSEALPNAGRPIEAVVAATWKPKEAAPSIATPHIGGPLAFWMSATRSLTGVLADLGAQLEGIPMERVVFPHYLSGPLDARQRLEFLRFHIQRHLGQIVTITSVPAYPR